MEDSMSDEQFVTTAEEIKEAREALIELGKDVVGMISDRVKCLLSNQDALRLS